ncbi:MAG TPA: PAS domain-containing protein [Aliidongia sp.]|nr:PAS domain-containing protein [Aliidongia sp.]
MPVLTLAEIPSPVIHRLHDYWLSKGGAEGRIPQRSDIDPLELVDILPNLAIIEVVEGRWRYRLIGTRIVEFVGRDSTGKYFDELEFDRMEPFWHRRYSKVFAGKVLQGREVMHWVGRDFIPYYWIGLPLLTADGMIGQAIGALDFSLSGN